jgi:C4-dicarboxylate transporter, DctM subunit
MDQPFAAAALVFGCMLLLLASGVWVAISLMSVGVVAVILLSPAPVGPVLATTVWDASWNWALTALPLFIWMGEILYRSRLSEDLFTGLAPWMGWLPGRLLHVNVVGCGIMAAVSGSSSVTCATVGRMSVPELAKQGYDQRMSIGTLAGSGTLGLLIPPSIMMIVYGIVAEVSIARLFIAGVLPGILLVLIFMGFVAGWALLNPDKTPVYALRMTLLEKLWNSRRLIPVVILIILILGSIYGGYATPTEAAMVGVLGALGLSAISGDLNRRVLVDGLLGAVQISVMLAFIVVCAQFLAVAMGFTGIPNQLATWVNEFGLSKYSLLVVLTVLYIFLGCFLEGISMVVLTASVVLPMVQTVGIDLVWFGIYIIFVVEMAQITPPVGLNLFVLQAMTGRDIWYITKAALPFFLLMILGVVIITIFPQIVMFLPELMIMNR